MKSASRVDLVGASRPSRRRARGSARRRRTGRRRATRMPKPCARCATSWPMRPKPRMPSVLSVQLDAARTSSAPSLPPIERRVRLRDVAREREQQRHRVLGGGDDVRLRRVGDDDAALGRGRDVDVVDADAGAADRPCSFGRACSISSAVDLRRRADQDAVVVADALGELAVLPVDAEVDVEVLARAARRRSRRCSPRRARCVMPSPPLRSTT